jgi:hypothetical protein
VDRTFRILAETHLRPQNKTNRLLFGSLLFSRLIPEGNAICCAIVPSSWSDCGSTVENYIITPRTPEARVAIWYRLNFDAATHDYLRAHARRQGRGRVHADDLLRLHTPPLTEDEHDACNKLLQQLEAKAELDRRLIRRLNEFKRDPSE